MITLGKGIIFITGNYGSGKTEVAVNLARNLARRGEDVTLADLDIVNPYFRCREAAAELEELGIRVIAPRGSFFFADLPIVLPEIRGAMLERRGIFLGDVGGDDVGARLLSSFADVFVEGSFELLFVVNANRPFTDTPEAVMKVMEEIETASRLPVGGLVANTHLMEDTDLGTVRAGYDLAAEVARRKGVPLRIVTAPAALADALAGESFADRLLPIERTMLPPWKRREKIGPSKFKLS
jgi:hypothetical protein